ncbi:hypothetical protein FB2170_08089 [Maribacter sp. HTCC2170]|nr:hypothetical protein FB2170_08089 [Maribacter sp. HTCC2170]
MGLFFQNDNFWALFWKYENYPTFSVVLSKKSIK